MKKIFTQHLYGKQVITCGLFFTIVVMIAFSIVESAPSTVTSANKEVSDKKIKISRKDHVVKIYPDVFKRILHVKNLVETPLDFYLFDLEGTLVLHYKMIGKEHKKISSLKRGSYMYQVFEGDTMSESGKINIK